MSVIFAGRECVDAARFYRECVDRRLPTDWAGKANRFEVPVGEGPGRGAVLFRGADLAALTRNGEFTLQFLGTDVSRSYTLTKIVLCKARCLSPGGEGDPLAVHLLDLADYRYHVARKPCDDAFNVSAADGTSYLTATLNAGTPWTWQQVVDRLATLAGLAAAQFVLPFAPDGTPENLTYWGGKAWAALCDVLARLACAAKYDPVLDEYEVVRLGSADAAAAAAMADLSGERVWDDYPTDPERAWRPATVQVQFLRRPRPTDGSTPYYSVDVAAGGLAVAGTCVQIRDDLTALGATGAPTNAAALATRAAERAADWIRKRSGFGRRLRKIYHDFDPEVPTDVIGSTAGRATLADETGLMVTEVASSPDDRLEGWEPLADLPPWYPADAGGTGAASMWLAQLTTQNPSAPNGWKWKKLTSDETGTYSFDGAESATYNAFPMPFSGTTLACTPFAGMKVIMKQSVTTTGTTLPVVMEFVPYTDFRRVELYKVTAYDAVTGYHTCQKVSWDGTAHNIVDGGATITTGLSTCVSIAVDPWAGGTTPGQIPNDTLVSATRIDGTDPTPLYWVTPVDYADVGFPGLLSATTQDISGWKRFQDSIDVAYSSASAAHKAAPGAYALAVHDGADSKGQNYNGAARVMVRLIPLFGGGNADRSQAPGIGTLDCNGYVRVATDTAGEPNTIFFDSDTNRMSHQYDKTTVRIFYTEKTESNIDFLAFDGKSKITLSWIDGHISDYAKTTPGTA